eukprot:5077515-Pyramimonas_sp.AAC.1
MWPGRTQPTFDGADRPAKRNSLGVLGRDRTDPGRDARAQLSTIFTAWAGDLRAARKPSLSECSEVPTLADSSP